METKIEMQFDKQIWKKLGGNPSGEKIVARLPHPEISESFYCGLDSSGSRHYLFQLEENDEIYSNKQVRGLEVATRELQIRGKDLVVYLDVECRDKAAFDIFDIIGQDIINHLIEGRLPPARIIELVISKWQRFWGKSPQQLLSVEAQIGLFAELWFFSRWLIPLMGSTSILAWRGPFGSRHDYEWPDKSVEVKATRSQGKVFRISSLTQLEPPENGALYFFGLVLREEAGAISNLPELIEECRSSLISTGRELDYFEGALSQSGYNPAHATEYASLRLRVWHELFYSVLDEFPRIVPTRFSKKDLIGIEALSYSINLDAFSKFLIADSPQKFRF